MIARRLWLVYEIDEGGMQIGGPFADSRIRTLAARAIVRSWGREAVSLARLDTGWNATRLVPVSPEEMEAWDA